MERAWTLVAPIVECVDCEFRPTESDFQHVSSRKRYLLPVRAACLYLPIIVTSSGKKMDIQFSLEFVFFIEIGESIWDTEDHLFSKVSG